MRNLLLRVATKLIKNMMVLNTNYDDHSWIFVLGKYSFLGYLEPFGGGSDLSRIAQKRLLW